MYPAALSLAVLALTGCSSLLGIEQLTGEDAGAPGSDGSGSRVDAGPVPGQITLSGSLLRLTASTTTAVNLEYHTPDEKLVMVGTADAAGDKYTMVVDTMGAPLDGYLEVRDPQGQLIPTRLYLPKPLVADTDLPINLFTAGDMQQISNFGGVNFNPMDAVLLVLVDDAADQPVGGAIVDITGPGDLRYGDANRLPASGLTATTAGVGLAWAFNVLPSPRMPTAQLPGQQFQGPLVSVRPTELVMLTLHPVMQ